ncbi:MAG TPA: thymidine kinase [Kouleothrix sp.]|uniref:thymidine kinase n=1 Tax=Kouleothrix sp. TaxID=2779161 RepID=UPI002D159916|nr:thymidine kinase [Kouleothrix sp.]HRC76370.1 thymidine kinase [Kouleothrix sp.]
MTRPGSGGRIEVICGCMYSGKTEELIRRLNHVQIARQRLQAFTPSRDTRYASGNLVSHNGVRIEAQPIHSIHQVGESLRDDVQVVALDELHFLDDDPDTILRTCQALAGRGLRVIIAGLDQDFRATPFPAMARLLAVAEQVDKLYAICVRCGAYATRSQRMIDGRPAPFDAPTIVVGGLELYEARCRACFEAG